MKSASSDLGEWEKHTKGIGAKLLLQVCNCCFSEFNMVKASLLNFGVQFFFCRWVINLEKALEKVYREEVSLWKLKFVKGEEQLVIIKTIELDR